VKVQRGTYKSGERKIRWAVHFDTVSHGLATDVQALLLRLGVVATVAPPTMFSYRTVPIYRVALSQMAFNLAEFARVVPAVGDKARRLVHMYGELPRGETSPGLFALPREMSAHLHSLKVGWKDQHKRMRRSTAVDWADRTGDEALKTYAESDLLWEQIRGIEPAGTEEVFDLRVPDAGNFLANGIVVHNSGALEADADLVMFLWQRDQNDRRDHIVRLKLAKHRNGPTAEIDLVFEPEITRFRDLGETQAS
jgi:replicative DNA helicase